MNKHQVRKLIRAFKAQQRAILNGCRDAKTGDIREMNEEECTRFDDLEKKVGKHEEMLSRLDAVEEDEDTERDDDEGGEEEDSKRTSGRSSDPNQFRDHVSPGVHTKKRRYSILRALNLAADRGRIDGLEGEISKEVRRRVPGKTWQGQFSMPIDPDPEMRAKMYPNAQRRDLTAETGAGGIFTVPDLPMIDLLRSRMVAAKLGCTFLTGMQGNFAIPRQSGKSTVNWLANESSSATPSNQTLDQVPFAPHIAVDLTNISRQFINQTSVSAEAFVLNDLAKSMGVELDRVAFFGSGSSGQPTGVGNNSTILSNSAALALGTNGGSLAWANIVNMETQVANLNADQGRLKYLTSPALRGTLKQTPKVTSSTFPIFIWEDGSGPGVGTVNSYEAHATTNVPSNLTKGTASGTCSAVIFGNWEDLIIASWDDGIDFLVNPFSNQASAAVTISMVMSVDTEVRHTESFSVIDDAIYTAF